MISHPPTLPATHPFFIAQCLLWSLLLFAHGALAADSLSLPAVSDGDYTIRWNIADANTYTEVFEKKNSGSYVSIHMQDGGTGHIDLKNKAAGTYHYKAVGCYTGPTSPVCTRSPTVTGRITVGPQTPARPSVRLPATAESAVSFTLSWGAVTFAHYYQWRVRAANSTQWGSAQRTTAVSASHRQTKAGVYHYAVRACGKTDRCSSWRSASAITITRADPPAFTGGDTYATHFSQRGEQVRATQGQYSVSHGSLSYTVPLKLPSLPGGLSADIKMDLLAGLRDNKELFQTPARHGLTTCYLSNKDDSDGLDIMRLCYEGATLVTDKPSSFSRVRSGPTHYDHYHVAESYWQLGTIYRSPLDPKLRITLVSDEQVKVERGNGEVFLYRLRSSETFKRDSNGVIERPGYRPPAIKWRLAEMRNAYGDTITYTYQTGNGVIATYSNGYTVQVRYKGSNQPRSVAQQLIVYDTTGGGKTPIRLYYGEYGREDATQHSSINGESCGTTCQLDEVYECGFKPNATDPSERICAAPLKPVYDKYATGKTQAGGLKHVTDGFGNVTRFEYIPIKVWRFFGDHETNSVSGFVSSIEDDAGASYAYVYSGANINEFKTVVAFRTVTRIDRLNHSYERTQYGFNRLHNGSPVIEKFERGVLDWFRPRPPYLQGLEDTLIPSQITTHRYKKRGEREDKHDWYVYQNSTKTQTYHINYYQEPNPTGGGTSFKDTSPNPLNSTLISTTHVEREVDPFGTETKVTTRILDQNNREYHRTFRHASRIRNDTEAWLLGFVHDVFIDSTLYDVGGTVKDGKSIHTASQPIPGTNDVANTSLFTYVPGESPELIRKETTERNARGLATRVIVKADGVERITTYGNYDEHGFPGYTDNALGHRRTMTYDQRFGLIHTLTDANGLTSTTHYSPFGEVRAQVNAREVSTNTLDFYCRNANIACPAGALYAQAKTVTHSYTSTFGAPTTIAYFDAQGRNVGDDIITPSGDRNRVLKAYYANGRIKTHSTRAVSASRRKNTRYYWYSDGRPWGRISPNGITHLYQHSVYSGQATTLHFAHSGSEGDRIDRTTVNILGQVEKINDASGVPGSYHLSTPVNYTYDAHGNLSRTVVNNDPDTTVHLEYDPLGQRTHINDPDAGRIGFRYTGFGDLLTQTWAPNTPQAKSMTYTYDALGRVTKRTDKAADGEVSDFVWEWDRAQKGRIDAVHSHIGRNRTDYPPEYREDRFYKGYTYNALGEVQQIQEWGNYYVPESEAYFSGGGVMNMTYDDFGREDTIKYPVNTGLKTQKRYYGSGFPMDLSETGNSTRRIYRHSKDSFNGDQSQVLYGNGVVSTRRYNALGQLTDIESGRHSDDGQRVGKEVQDLNYRYHSFGGLSRRHSITPTRNTKESFTYDGLNRVKTASLSGYNYLQTSYNTATKHYYNYDKLGNLIYRSDKGLVDNNSQTAQNIFYGQIRKAGVHAVTHAYGRGTQRTGQVIYDYDAYGNVTSRGGKALKYNVFNKPTQIDKVHFGYAADHARYVQYKEGRVVFYSFGGRYKDIQTGAANNVDHEYIVNIDGVYQYKRIVKGKNKQTERRFLHGDHLGSINAVTNELGQVVSRAQYNVWGEQIVQTGSGLKALSTDLGFTGHETLSDSGLVHMNGRVYDPTIARFLSADLYVQSPLNSQSYNRYAYVFNNPLGYTDPTGYQATCAGNIPCSQEEYEREREWERRQEILTELAETAALQEEIQDRIDMALRLSNLDGAIDGLAELFGSAAKAADLQAELNALNSVTTAKSSGVSGGAGGGSSGPSHEGSSQEGSGSSESGSTKGLFNSCNDGNSGACSALKSRNQRDLKTAYSFIQTNLPEVTKRVGGIFSQGDLKKITFNQTKKFRRGREQVNGETSPYLGRIELSSLYGSLGGLVNTLAHELTHSGDGYFGRIRTGIEDSRDNPVYGPSHQNAVDIGDRAEELFNSINSSNSDR